MKLDTKVPERQGAIISFEPILRKFELQRDDSITLVQGHRMHERPLLLCIVTQLKDLYIMIAGYDEEMQGVNSARR